MVDVVLVHMNMADYSAALANALAERVRLVVVYPSRLDDAMTPRLDPDVLRITFDKPRFRSPRNALAVKDLRRLLSNLQPSLVHLQQTDDPWMDAAFLAPRKWPLVLTVHDLEKHPGDRDQVPGGALLRPPLVRRADGIVVHTDGHRTRLERSRATRGPVRTIPHGELASLYSRLASADGADHARRDIFAKGPVVLFFGRVWHYKGLDLLISAMEQVRRAVPNAQLLVAGRGEPAERYFPTGLPDWCSYAGEQIADAEVFGLLRDVAVVVLPYREASQSGVAALAMGSGSAVVATRVGGLREVINHEEDGILVPPESIGELAGAITDLLTDPAKAARLGSAARRRGLTDLAWSRVSEATVDLYRAVGWRPRQAT